MTAAANGTPCIRAPWPDEIPRLRSFLRGAFSEMPAEALPFVAVEGPFERIVVAAALAGATARSMASFVLRSRPRALREGKAGALLETLLDHARTAGCSGLLTVLPSGASTTPLLEARGFLCRKTEELWSLDLARLQERLAKLSQRLRPPQDWVIRPPEQGDDKRIAALVADFGFRQAGAVQFNDTSSPGKGYTRRLSSVVEQEGQLLAVLLANGSRGLVGHVDVRAVEPAAAPHSGLLNYLLLQRSVQAARDEGYQTTTLTVNVERDLETRNLARRTGAILLQSKQLWSLALDKQP